MKLVTYSYRGAARLGALLADARVADLNRALAAAWGADDADCLLPAEMIPFLRAGEDALDRARSALAFAGELQRRDPERARDCGIVFGMDEPGLRLEAPVPRPRTVLAIGLNYQAHVAESTAAGAPPPETPAHPTVFTKVSSCITGPAAPIHVPKASALVDWEGELCFVIGRRARRVAAEDAFDHIAGYMIGNDISVRDWQFHSPTWIMGKGFDTHGPTGPALVTKDDVADVSNLRLQTWVNGDLRQDATTADLIFTIPTLIEYITTAFTLEPGDIVFTGTPAGVGAAMKPPQWLQAGDTVRVAISGLGVLENPVIDEPAEPGARGGVRV